MDARMYFGMMLIGLATLLAGADASAAQTGTVYVSRGNGLTSALVASDIAVDGKVVGSVGNGECVRLQVPAGRRVIGSPAFIWGTVRESATINVPAGGHVFVTAVPKMEWPGPVHWTAIVPTAAGRRC